MKRITSSLLACALAASMAGSAHAQGNGYVGIYADAQGTAPCTTVPQGTGATLYLIATLSGGSADGITAAEFRIEVSNPAGWFFSYMAPSGAIPIGSVFDTEPANPDDGSGLDVAFSSCQWDSSGKVSLGTIWVYNTSGNETSLSVKRHSRPPNPAYTCPLFVACDGPAYTKTCMTPGSEPACDLSKPVMLGSIDPAVFVAGLNVIPEGGGGGPGEPHPMLRDPLVHVPLIVANPVEPDIVGIDGSGGQGKAGIPRVAVDTTWIADYSFDGAPGTCNTSGWTAEDHLVRNTSRNYWGVDTHYAGEGYIVNKAAELRLAGCWAQTGYGNLWDQSVIDYCINNAIVRPKKKAGRIRGCTSSSCSVSGALWRATASSAAAVPRDHPGVHLPDPISSEPRRFRRG